MLPDSPSNSASDSAGRSDLGDRPSPVRLAFSYAAAQHGVSSAAVDALLEHLPVGVWLVDRDGRVVFANEMARSLRVEGLEQLQWAITRALLTEDPVRADEIQVVVKGQPRRWLSAQITPVRLAGHGVTAAFVTVTDATDGTRMRHWGPVIETLVNL